MKTTPTSRDLLSATVALSLTLLPGAQACSPYSCATPARTEKAAVRKQPVVQLALLLDTSGSMSGLIDQAKGQLWKIVNEFINATQDGQRPEVQVALYEYGKSSLKAETGWVRQIQDFTTDLDKVSEELFSLTTNGGEEYCGWVIRDAVDKLAWTASEKDFKAIFIAGNEPFTQGPVDYAVSCKAAITRGIMVNTIHCGGEATGIATKWKDGATLAEGKYMTIDQNRAVAHVAAPQDKAIADLGVELNKTYVPYGRAGEQSAERQAVQDGKALEFAAQGSAVQRALCKASANYNNSSWDLVDALQEGKVKLADLKEAELPKELQKLSELERKEYVEKHLALRNKLQEDIKRLNAERSAYLAGQTGQNQESQTLDQVIITAIREQGATRHYKFK